MAHQKGQELIGSPSPPTAISLRSYPRPGGTGLLLGSASAPTAISLKSTGTVLIATLSFPEKTAFVVVKQLLETLKPADIEQLCRVHREVRAADPLVARCTPRLLGFESDRNLLAMDFVPGETLHRVLRRALWLPPWGDGHCHSLLEKTAEALVAVNGFSAHALGVPPAEPRLNGSYIPLFEATWTSPLVRPLLPPEWRDPDRLYRFLPTGFFEGVGDSLNLTDPQPKNVLVTPGNQVCHIDIEYVGGNQVLCAAQFLVGIDRLGLRHPASWLSSRLAGWKQCFVDRFAENAQSAMGDLRFFYPFVLLHNLRKQLESRPLWRWWLLQYHGRRLCEFLNNLGLEKGGGDNCSNYHMFGAAPSVGSKHLVKRV